MSVQDSTSCWPGSTPSFRSASAILLLAGQRNTSSMSLTCEWHVTPWIPGWKVWHRYVPSVLLLCPKCVQWIFTVSSGNTQQAPCTFRPSSVVFLLEDLALLSIYLWAYISPFLFRVGPTCPLTRFHGVPSGHYSPSVSMVEGLTMILTRGCSTPLFIGSSQPGALSPTSH